MYAWLASYSYHAAVKDAATRKRRLRGSTPLAPDRRAVTPRHLVSDVDVQRLGELSTDDDAGYSSGNTTASSTSLSSLVVKKGVDWFPSDRPPPAAIQPLGVSAGRLASTFVFSR